MMSDHERRIFWWAMFAAVIGLVVMICQLAAKHG